MQDNKNVTRKYAHIKNASGKCHAAKKTVETMGESQNGQ